MIGVLLVAAFVPMSRARGVEAPPVLSTLDTPTEIETTTVETLPPSPPTTSEFGTETEIEIALDEDGNIIPG